MNLHDRSTDIDLAHCKWDHIECCSYVTLKSKSCFPWLQLVGYVEVAMYFSLVSALATAIDPWAAVQTRRKQIYPLAANISSQW